MGIYKNTSVALTIGLLELTAQARQISEETFRTFAAFGSATILYLILALVAYQIMRWIDNRVKIPGAVTSSQKSRSVTVSALHEGASS
jgi:glutamate/aspartate transport system permease protein